MEAVRGGMSVRQASEQFDVRRSTLHDRVKNKHDKNPGRPCELDVDTERKLAELVDVVAGWGYPLGSLEIRLLVKNYLDTLGVVSPVFINNLPGERWMRRFAERCNLSARVASNIKRARASVSETMVNQFFDELTAGGVADVPPANIFNFDETNFSDDPGAKKCFVRRSTRRVEMVREHSKTSISVMWCGYYSRLSKVAPMRETQKAFRKVDGTADNLVILDTLLRDARTRLKPLHLAFVDLRKAVESVGHDTIVRAAVRLGVPAPLVG